MKNKLLISCLAVCVMIGGYYSYVAISHYLSKIFFTNVLTLANNKNIFYGYTELSGQQFSSLIIYGSGKLDEINIRDSLTANGNLTISNSVVGNIVAHGAAKLHNVTIKNKMQIYGYLRGEKVRVQSIRNFC